MQPTIDAFLALLGEHPGQPEVLDEVGGSYDTAGEEQTALGYYEAALDGRDSRATRCAECLHAVREHAADCSGATSDVGRRARPGARRAGRTRRRCARSTPSGCTRRGAAHGAVGELLALVADGVRTPDVLRYEAALHGNAGFLLGLDAAR